MYYIVYDWSLALEYLTEFLKHPPLALAQHYFI